MNTPLINILIRVSRMEMFAKCIASVKQQTYGNINIIACFDSVIHFSEYIQSERVDWCDKVMQVHYKDRSLSHFWNLYCNDLKKVVDDGFFLYLDDDDYLINKDVLTNLSQYLTEDVDGVVVQFLRNGKPKPNDSLIASGTIRKGLIGGGCLVLNSKWKDIADWEAREAADYYWIKEVANRVGLKFIPLVVQVAGNNGLHGKTN